MTEMTPEEREAFYAETRKLVPASARKPELNGPTPAEFAAMVAEARAEQAADREARQAERRQQRQASRRVYARVFGLGLVGGLIRGWRK